MNVDSVLHVCLGGAAKSGLPAEGARERERERDS